MARKMTKEEKDRKAKARKARAAADRLLAKAQATMLRASRENDPKGLNKAAELYAQQGALLDTWQDLSDPSRIYGIRPAGDTARFYAEGLRAQAAQILAGGGR